MNSRFFLCCSDLIQFQLIDFVIRESVSPLIIVVVVLVVLLCWLQGGCGAGYGGEEIVLLLLVVVVLLLHLYHHIYSPLFLELLYLLLGLIYIAVSL